MTSELSNFAARLRERLLIPEGRTWNAEISGSQHLATDNSDADFNALALELFALQYAGNPVYRRVCEARRRPPEDVREWRDIPPMPTAAFKEFDLTCLPSEQRTHVFYSSGTTEQRPSRHFHSAESLALYEEALWPWFVPHVLPDFKLQISNLKLVVLTPPPAQAPRSSLVHMFEIVRRRLGADESAFCGKLARDRAWELDLPQTLAHLRAAIESRIPLVLLGTAFSFVNLLDLLGEQNLRFKVPPGSRAMETGGYKGRSRTLPKAGLHALITNRLGILPSHIVCEYGMSELSSQAYNSVAGGEWRLTGDKTGSRHALPVTRHFRFPPWARTQVISPETGREVAEGETGLLRMFDLANVWSVMAIQTEDLAVRRGGGFELVGRTLLAEPRGCSLMSA